MPVGAVTKRWIRNVADERAAEAGCTFDAERGQFVVDWIERYCKLYEGSPGEPMILLPWFRDCTMRIFGWVRYSAKWKRRIRRFRQAVVFVAKKNAKSPGLAAWGLYLLCGDGEPGQKVFLAAKDGMQARKIAGEHMVAMLEQSTELSSVCTLNRSTMRVTHHPTRSWMEPLSSSNSRTQESKEGLNGSVLIDEVHVVDRDFVRRISRAGISRSEPLQIEVSTAVNNPDGYGRERFDYAMDVLNGTRTDPDLFAAIYAAPQDLSDEDLNADPMKWGKMANPAMGQTVDPEEYLKDYQTSKRSLQALIDFRMYRLNIWAKGSNPWLRAGDWDKCRREFTEEDLAGRDCWAGLDLSRTRDMTALALVFHGDNEGEYFLLNYFWLPEERVAELAAKVDMTPWVRSGHLCLMPGGVTNFGFVRAKFRELAARFNIRELVYDPRFAEETTQHIAEGYTDDAGRTLEEGTWTERIVFAQNDENFAGPTDDFERLVIGGKLHHNGNPVAAWQIGHAQVMLKISKAKRVVKPSKDDYRTVDGVVAAIMALSRAATASSGDGGFEEW